MKTVHLTDRITAIHGDCIKYLESIESNCVDLAIVDPPYGINADNMQMGSAPNRKEKGKYPGTSTAVRLKKGRLNQGSGKLKNRILNRSDCSWDYEKPTKEYFDALFDIIRQPFSYPLKSVCKRFILKTLGRPMPYWGLNGTGHA